jgi:mycothiol synthase
MTGNITARAYEGDHELIRLAEFVCRVNGLAPPHTYWHLGDLFWNTCFSMEAERQRTIRLWERDSTLHGFAWFESPHSVALFVHPTLRGRGTLEAPMIAWASDLARASQTGGDARLWTTALESDTAYITYLIAHGWERDDLYSLRMVRSLDGTLPPPQAPEGWTIRSVGGEDEWPRRVELHREVWQPSNLTLEKYQRLRSSSVYTSDLDLVAVAHDGTFASYAGGWLDALNGTGLFEPVGTLVDYRRQGLSTAVLREGLRRMQARGAHTAWISTGPKNTQAASLYQALGFEIINDYRYSLRL